MAGCLACRGCCAQCADTCGAIGGGAIGTYEESDASWYSYFSTNPPLPSGDNGAALVERDALVDSNHPGHRGAIESISHVNNEQHQKILQWLRNGLHHRDDGGEPQG